MQHVQCNLSKEVGRLHGWSGPMWGRRYRGISVSEEEAVQYSGLRYVLEQGCKENLVSSPLEWPGVNSAWYLWKGLTEMEGEWVDRTAMFLCASGLRPQRTAFDEVAQARLHGSTRAVAG